METATLRGNGRKQQQRYAHFSMPATCYHSQLKQMKLQRRLHRYLQTPATRHRSQPKPGLEINVLLEMAAFTLTNLLQIRMETATLSAHGRNQQQTYAHWSMPATRYRSQLQQMKSQNLHGISKR